MIKVFIDGAEGTTGLQLEQKLSELPIELLKIENDMRKNVSRRKHYVNLADVVFLCLPDDAAREAVALAEDNPGVVIIDASTAHRTASGWAYGFPELSKAHEDAVKTGNRIAVPGCYATAFCGLVYPLVRKGLIARDAELSCFGLSGYSGAGKTLISKYEDSPENAPRGTRPYAFALQHKHLPEMRIICGLDKPPLFTPAVAPVKQGMLVSVPLHMPALPLWEALNAHYAGKQYVKVMPFGGEGQLNGGFLEMEALNGTNTMELFVFGHDSQALLTARLDNLGKGASGAALQCMKLRMGI